MSDQFDDLIGNLLAVEGGYTNDPSDSGGETIWGITKAVARANGYARAMRDMTRTEAKAIYRAIYWTKAGLPAISAHSRPIAAEVFDTGVNMGVGVAGRFLQRALNVLNNGGKDYADLAVDGALGPATAKALGAFMAKRGQAGENVLLTMLNCLQGARYVELAEAREKDERFVYGWFANRVTL